MARLASVVAFAALLAGCTHTLPGTPAAAGLSYVVFFQEWSAALDGPARKVIADAAASARSNPDAPILVSGFAANDSGTNAANRSMSGVRAQVVVDALKQDGVSAGRIRGKAAGSTDFSLDPVEARRVEISVGTF